MTARAVAVLIALAAGSCAGKKTTKGAAAPAVPTFRLDIQARPDANRGGPVYVVIRKTDPAGFLADDYDAIARGLFSREPDPRVLGKRSVGPGQNVRLEVPRELAKGEVLGIYALFSAPGSDWRVAILDADIDAMTLVLGRDRIVSITERP